MRKNMRKNTALLILVTSLMVLGAITLTGCKEGQKRYTIKLEGNPTTGYEWTYVMKPEGIVREVSSDYKQDKAPLDYTGVGGEYTYVFEGVSPGKVELLFTYARPWEDDAGIATTESFKLSVDSDLRITER